MQGVMIVYAVFAGIIILIFVIILVATIVLRIIERLRKRPSESASSTHRNGGTGLGSGKRRLHV